jgi:hypothetical protein
MRGPELINRKEALMRVKRIVGIDKSSRMADMLETMVHACNAARINELGRGYDKNTLDTLLASIRTGREEARLRDKNVALPGMAPSGGTRTTADEIAERAAGNAPSGGEPSAEEPQTPEEQANETCSQRQYSEG